MKTYQMYINGAWENSEAGATAEVLNPSTGKVIATIQDGTEVDAQRALEAA